MLRSLLVLLALLALLPLGTFYAAEGDVKPNIVILYADDLGYGDTGCYGATKVKTPNIDRLAAEGLRFTDGHCTSATCTPSRFGLLTGKYPWRQKGTAILPGDAELIIKPGSFTLPAMLKKAGYSSAAIGKWHLGLGDSKIDWNGEIKPGPLEIGFDYCFIMPATGDRVPCVYLENHKIVGLDPKDPIQVSYGNPVGDEPTGKAHPELLKYPPSHGHDQTIVNGISRIGYMSGGKAARWVDEDLADVLTQKAVAFIESHKSAPFCLYFAAHDIHVPRMPHARYAGKSECGIRGDVIEQFDGCVGTIMKTLEKLGLDKNTLVIVSSDNGPVVDDGYKDGAVEKLNGHRPSGPLRGGKYSIFEAGTRVPFITYWPGKIKPGVSDALICQIDFIASFAALTGQQLEAGVAPDSQNILPALLGDKNDARESLVEQDQRNLAIRVKNWKYIPAFKNQKEGADKLYDLSKDPGETQDVSASQPEQVKSMRELLSKVQGDAR